MTTDERLAWLLERQSGIGASDVADIIGRGWSGADGPLRVYRSKVEPPDPRLSESGPLRRGHDLEELVAAKYAEVMGEPLAVVPLVRRNGFSWMFASNDRRRADGRKVELKTTTGWNEWGEQGTDDVPDKYRLQCQWQMLVTGDGSMDVFALDIMSWTTRLYRLDCDEGVQGELWAAAEAFWTNHVLPRVPPGPEWLARFADTKVLFTPGSAVELDDKVAALCDRRRVAQTTRDVADAEVKQLTDEIVAAMGDAEKAVAGRWRIRRTRVPGGEVRYTRDGYVRTDIRSS